MLLENGVGLGTYPFANPFTPLTAESAKEVLKTYLDNGGKYFDVSPTYDFGGVEKLIGTVISTYSRDSYFINSSCGYVLNKDGKYEVSGKRQDVIDDCHGSLVNLGVDYIDLYISHIPDLNTTFDETIAAMEELRRDGKIRKIGVSNVTLDQLKKYNKSGAISYVQNRFSLLNQTFDHELVNYCKQNRIGLVAYQVIERGLLTDKIITGLNLREGDLRTRKPEFKDQIVQVIGQWVSQDIAPIAQELNIPVATLAIWWVIQQDGVALAQNGVTNTDQVKSMLLATSITPPTGTLEHINEAYNKLSESIMTQYSQSVREFMGLESYNVYGGSASGRVS